MKTYVPKTWFKKTIFCSLLIGLVFSANSAHAGKVQAQLHVTVIVTAQCSVRSHLRETYGRVPDLPAVACDHPRRVRYHWDNLPEREARVDGGGNPGHFFSGGRTAQSDARDHQSVLTGQRNNHVSPHILTILY